MDETCVDGVWEMKWGTMFDLEDYGDYLMSVLVEFVVSGGGAWKDWEGTQHSQYDCVDHDEICIRTWIGVVVIEEGYRKCVCWGVCGG